MSSVSLEEQRKRRQKINLDYVMRIITVWAWQEYFILKQSGDVAFDVGICHKGEDIFEMHYGNCRFQSLWSLTHG